MIVGQAACRLAKKVLVRIAALVNSIKVTPLDSSVTNCCVRPLASYTSELKYCVQSVATRGQQIFM